MKKMFALFCGCLFFFVVATSSLFAQSNGKAIVESECAKCHGIKKVKSANKKPAEWVVTLDRMIKKGAVVKAEEKDLVLKYLNTLNK